MQRVHLFHLLFFTGFINAATAESERAVREKLLKDYDKTLPPIIFAKQIHYTFININILRIRGLDESKGELLLEGPIGIYWTDERLTWESDTIKRMTFFPGDIWIPHLRILNRVEEDEMTLNPAPVVLQGTAVWVPRLTLRTSCIPNLKYFPFDRQNCEIFIVPVSEEGDLIQTNYSSNLDVSNDVLVTTRYLIENNRWKLLSAGTTVKKMQTDPSGSENDVGVYRFEIERSMPLIALAVLSPSVLSMFLFLVTFWMRAGSEIRTALTATSILVSAGCLFTIGKILPVTGFSTPIIVEYVVISLILSTLSALQAVVVSVLSRCKKQPPVPFATILEKFPRWLLILLALLPQTDENTTPDQTFLFSELSENETRQAPEPVSCRPVCQNSWEKHILLLDRLMFYVIGAVCVLLIISILFTE